VTLVLVLLFLPLSFSALQTYMEAIVQLIVGV
jgi:hypothetical protein